MIVTREPKERWARILAWGVHLYTASGLVAAACMAVLIVQGTTTSFFRAFALMWLATLIDGTDGTLARRVRVKAVLPGFDGRRLDDLTDFLTYTFLPLFIMWRAEVLPPGQYGWLLVPLLASAYGFCQADAKTDDGFFLGFPSYWNVIAFYLYTLQPDPWVCLWVVLFFSVMTFVPARYLYPSNPGRLNRFTNMLAVPWALSLVWVIYRCLASNSPARIPDSGVERVLIASLAFPILYLVVSWVLTLRLWREKSGGR